jgi:hypothetical protein
MLKVKRLDILIILKSLGARKPKDLKSINTRHKGSNTGKRARRKNLRHPRERFLVSNEAPPS